MLIYGNLNTGLMVHWWNLASKSTRQLHQIHLFSIFFLPPSFFSYFACGRWRDSFWWYHLWKLPSCRLCFSICDRSCFCNLSLLTKPVPLRSCQLSVTLPAWFGMGKTTGRTQIAKKLGILNLSVRFIDDHSIIHVNLWWNFLNTSQNKIRSHATWHLCNKNDIHEYHNGICHYMLRAIMCGIEVMIQWYNLIKGLTWALPFFPGDSFKQKKWNARPYSDCWSRSFDQIPSQQCSATPPLLPHALGTGGHRQLSWRIKRLEEKHVTNF